MDLKVTAICGRPVLRLCRHVMPTVFIMLRQEMLTWQLPQGVLTFVVLCGVCRAAACPAGAPQELRHLVAECRAAVQHSPAASIPGHGLDHGPGPDKQMHTGADCCACAVSPAAHGDT